VIVTADNKYLDFTGIPTAASAFTASAAIVPSGATCTVDGTPTFGGAAVGAIDPGPHQILVTGGVSSSDCGVQYAPGTLTIGPRPTLTVTVDAKTKVYDAAPYVLMLPFTITSSQSPSSPVCTVLGHPIFGGAGATAV